MRRHVLFNPPEYYTGSTIRVPRTYSEAVKLTLSSGGPLTSILLIISGAIARSFIGPWQAWDTLAVVFVIGGWSFLEWAIHNYALHARPLPIIGRAMPSALSRIHALHHKDPWDPRTLHFKGITILAAWTMATLTLTMLISFGPALTFSTCLFMMIESYQWFHMIVHSKIQVRSPILKRLVKTHVNHHVIDDRLWMGVSTFWADELLGTTSSKEQIAEVDPPK
jgi:hypothetical protein